MKEIAIHVTCWLNATGLPTMFGREFPLGDKKSAYVSTYRERISDSLYSKKERITPTAEFIPVYDCACLIIIGNVIYFVSI